jgi:hypothetical protein
MQAPPQEHPSHRRPQQPGEMAPMAMAPHQHGQLSQAGYQNLQAMKMVAGPSSAREFYEQGRRFSRELASRVDDDTPTLVRCAVRAPRCFRTMKRVTAPHQPASPKSAADAQAPMVGPSSAPSLQQMHAAQQHQHHMVQPAVPYRSGPMVVNGSYALAAGPPQHPGQHPPGHDPRISAQLQVWTLPDHSQSLSSRPPAPPVSRSAHPSVHSSARLPSCTCSCCMM